MPTNAASRSTPVMQRRSSIAAAADAGIQSARVPSKTQTVPSPRPAPALCRAPSPALLGHLTALSAWGGSLRFLWKKKNLRNHPKLSPARYRHGGRTRARAGTPRNKILGSTDLEAIIAPAPAHLLSTRQLGGVRLFVFLDEPPDSRSTGP